MNSAPNFNTSAPFAQGGHLHRSVQDAALPQSCSIVSNIGSIVLLRCWSYPGSDLTSGAVAASFLLRLQLPEPTDVCRARIASAPALTSASACRPAFLYSIF